MPIDLEAIEARLAAATPGPWEFFHGYIFGKDGAMVADMDLEEAPKALTRARGYGAGGDRDLRNGECIAALHGDVGALLEEVRRLRAERESVTAVIEQHLEGCCTGWGGETDFRDAVEKALEGPS